MFDGAAYQQMFKFVTTQLGAKHWWSAAYSDRTGALGVFSAVKNKKALSKKASMLETVDWTATVEQKLEDDRLRYAR